MMGYGEMATITQPLSDEAITILADDFKRTVEITHAADEEVRARRDGPRTGPKTSSAGRR